MTCPLKGESVGSIVESAGRFEKLRLMTRVQLDFWEFSDMAHENYSALNTDDDHSIV